jgi:hypothetical protein
LDDIDLTVQARGEEFYTSRGNDYDSARGEVLWQRTLERGDWRVRTETRTLLTANSQEFHVRADIDAYETDGEGERRVFCRSWQRKIPRDLV